MRQIISHRTRFTRTIGLFGAAIATSATTVPTTGCVATSAEETPAKPTIVTFNEAHNGQTVIIKEGGKFEVILESNASTGYQWDVATINTTVITSEGPSTYILPKDAPPGATAKQVFHFKAKSAGNTKLVLHYARPWEKGKDPVQIFTLHLTIKAKV